MSRLLEAVALATWLCPLVLVGAAVYVLLPSPLQEAVRAHPEVLGLIFVIYYEPVMILNLRLREGIGLDREF